MLWKMLSVQPLLVLVLQASAGREGPSLYWALVTEDESLSWLSSAKPSMTYQTLITATNT